MSVNKVMLLGRLGQNPELRYTSSGQGVCTFSLATNDYWMDKNTGQKQEKTEWHRIVVWGKMGETCNQYLAKGREAFVEGSLQTRSWEKDGVKRYTTEVVARSVKFVGGRQGAYEERAPEAPAPEAPMASSAAPGEGDFSSENIPF